MSTQHTPEPWEQDDTAPGIVYGADQSWIATTDIREDTAKANARRIVLCVNACAGETDAKLQAVIDCGGYEGVIAAMNNFSARLDAMTVQRDELLAALKEVQMYATSRGYFFPKSAVEAIAKAGAQAVLQPVTTVTVCLDDLNALANLICDRDNRTEAPTIENIDQSHALIIKMMGKHAAHYYDDEKSEALA